MQRSFGTNENMDFFLHVIKNVVVQKGKRVESTEVEAT